jgi:hypothetical protein
MADTKMYEKNGGRNGAGDIDAVEKIQSRPQNFEQVDLNNNVAAKLRNPLSGIPREALMAQVEDFARQKDLEHALPALKKGALLAQSPVCGITTDRSASQLYLTSHPSLATKRANTTLSPV